MSSSPPLVVADRYRLVAPLGQGGMGRVWRATDVVLHRDVAIKELVPPPGLTAGERQEMRERSLREARAIARLNNINVVRVFDVLRTDADPWIVMEYVASRSLQDTLASDGPFTPVKAAEIGLGVLGALRAAHRAGVVHRDVKPGNVLLGADGRVVLTDFGLATVPGDPNVTRTGLVLGSPAYIAPERARDGTAGPAADLWSLGATLYAAVEGASPFARPSAIATLAALATENPPPARNAGPLKPVLNGLLRKDPTHRINADEAERLLLRAAGRKSRLAFPMSPTMRRPGAGRERPALPGTGGVFTPTGSTPVVPGPRPPVAPARPANPPGQAPAAGGRPAVGEGRPPAFVPGKAPVGRPPSETPTRVDGPKVDVGRLDATRVDTPPVRDDKTTKLFGTRPASPTAPSSSPESGGRRQGAAPESGLTRTSRGGPGGLTAADVAANRRRKAAPEHEQSLAEATALVRRPEPSAPEKPADRTAVPADPTMVVAAGRTPAADPTMLVSKPPADATTVVGKPKPQATEAAPSSAPDADAAAEAAPATPPSTAEERTAPDTSAQAEDSPVSAAASTAPAAPPAEDVPVPAEASAASAADASVSAEAAASVTPQDTATEAETATTPADAKSATPRKKAAPARKKAATPRKGATTAAAKTADDKAPQTTEPETADSAGQPVASGPAAKTPTEEGKAEAGSSNPEAEDQAGTGDQTGAQDKPAPGDDAAVAPKAEVEADQAVGDEPAQPEDQSKSDPAAAKASPAPAKTEKSESVKAVEDEEAAEDERAAEVPVPLGRPSAPEPTDDDATTVAPLRSIDRPARPAWRPMEIRPPAPRGGVTVFGTRLTYIQAAIGAGIIALVLILVVVLAVKTFGDDGQPAAGPKAGATTRAAPTRTTTQPSPAGTSAAASQPASQAPTSAPPTSAPPTSAPASTGTLTLPAGWYLYADSTGFSVPIPRSADISRDGSEVRITWDNRLLLIDQSTDPKPSALADWQNQERTRARSVYRNYQKIKLVAVPGYFEDTADWEFTYTTGKGNAQHALKRNIVVNDHQAYSVSWYTSPGDWAASQSQLQLIYQGFKPKQ